MLGNELSRLLVPPRWCVCRSGLWSSRFNCLGQTLVQFMMVQFERVIEFAQPLGRVAVATVFSSAKGLHEHGRPQILVGVPPVTGSSCTQDKLVHAIELGSVIPQLQKVGLTFLLGCSGLQPGFNAPVLLVKSG